MQHLNLATDLRRRFPRDGESHASGINEIMEQLVYARIEGGEKGVRERLRRVGYQELKDLGDAAERMRGSVASEGIGIGKLIQGMRRKILGPNHDEYVQDMLRIVTDAAADARFFAELGAAGAKYVKRDTSPEALYRNHTSGTNEGTRRAA